MKNKYVKMTLIAALVLSLITIFNNAAKTETSIVEESQNQLTSPSPTSETEKSGFKAFESFTEEEQKQIHLDLTQAEVKARKEAESEYETDPTKPNYSEENIYKKHDLQTELTERYKQDVLTKYNIDKSTQIKIVAEGIEKNWPVDFRY